MESSGGTGTASRVIPVGRDRFAVGALVQANHGIRPWFTVAGVPLGKRMTEDRIAGIDHETGSIIVILATDLPLLPGRLERLARRASIGIGRTGSPGGNNSGDIFLAFSTANAMPLPRLSEAWRTLTSLNALCAARNVPLARPPDGICRALDITALQQVFRGRERPPLP